MEVLFLSVIVSPWSNCDSKSGFDGPFPKYGTVTKGRWWSCNFSKERSFSDLIDKSESTSTMLPGKPPKDDLKLTIWLLVANLTWESDIILLL